jgi:S-DNA-T family DNA segregation ATPase FtsK/SpoIIIE
MDLTVTVVDASTGGSADLRVTAPGAAPAAPVLASLRQALGADPEAPLSVDGRPVAAEGTVADCGIADGQVIRVGGAVSRPQHIATVLVIASGPAAGHRIALSDGDRLIGRDLNCDVAVADASISRRHLRITTVSGTTTVTDLNSANGTLVDGEPLLPQLPARLAIGATVSIGDSELRVVEEPPSAATAPLLDGQPIIHRAPRLLAPTAPVEVSFPPPPPTPLPVRVPMLAAITPLIAGVALSLLLHQWQFLAFTALSPIMILGQAGSDRRSSRRSAREAAGSHDRATAEAGELLAAALAAERLRRRVAAPDISELTGAATARTRALWQRARNDPDALTLRLGRGNLPSDVRVVGGPGPAMVTDVPICVSLREVAVLGLCGPSALTAGLVRSLVIQAATLHSPADLRIVVLAPGRAQEWAWARWLPHLMARDEACTALFGLDDEQLRTRVAELTGRAVRDSDLEPHTLVIVDGAAGLRNSAAVLSLLERRAPTTSILWSATDERDLPGACQGVVRLFRAPRTELDFTRAGRADRSPATPDLVSPSVAEAAARALAPLRTARSETGDLPRTVRWADLNPVDVRARSDATRSLLKHWALGPSTAVILGQGADGAVRVDLGRDGPHALIAGTTGSGKSELLLSLVAGLAAANAPDQLSLLLIDHKGGAAFDQCAGLPHTIGVVTDLDGATTQRALLSLTAELRRREQLLAAVGATDLHTYRESGRGNNPLARLVIVVDEFASLAEEQPEFVGGLVGIAQRGRSLGVNLVLATQRPDGAVSADIRANTRLRICLGVARDNDSRDVIDCPDAASISRTTPGRGYLRIGPGELQAFQTAQIGGTRPSPSRPTITVSPVTMLGDVRPPITADPAARTDLDLLVQAANDAAASLGCATPPPPWLPPLPDRLTVSELPAIDQPAVVAWALLDLPATGRQRPLCLDLTRGDTTLIAGTARSGRTTAAATMATTAAARVPPERLRIWAVDASSGLRALADLPHCGAVVPAHDTERVERLLAHLSDEVARRRQAPNGEGPALMVVIDSWEGLAAGGDLRDGGRLGDTVLRLATEGPSAHLHVIITCDRGGLIGRLGAAASNKLVLRLADPGDFALIGMSGRDLPGDLPAGRGFLAADLTLAQVALLDASTVRAATAWPAPKTVVRRFAPLPHRISLSDLPAPDHSPGGHLVLGISADDLSPVLVSRAALGRSFVIAGPPGSGRSTALLLLARQLSARPIAVSCASRSPLAEHPATIWLPRDDQDHALAILDSLSGTSSPPPDVLIDDADLLAEGPLWTRLETLIREGCDGSRVIALSGTPDAIAVAFRGPLVQAKRGKVGLLLCPAGPHDGEVLGIRLPRRDLGDEPPGRGWLARGGRATRLQLADPGAQPRTELELSAFGVRRRE